MDQQSNDRRSPGSRMGAGMGIGIAIGVAIGVAMGNIAIGIAIGVAIGAGIGAGLSRRSGDVEAVGGEAAGIRRTWLVAVLMGLLVVLVVAALVFLLVRQ